MTTGTRRGSVASHAHMRRSAVVVLVVGLLAACSSSKSKPSASEPTSTGSGVTAHAVNVVPSFDVVLDDDGLTFPPGTTLAREYVISFEDRRTSPPPDQHLHLQFLPSGLRIVLIDVPAGTSSRHAILGNMVAEVVYFDPGVSLDTGFLRPQDMAHRHSIGTVPVKNPLSIETTPEFPTPVT